MTQDAGIDIDMDADLADIQGITSGVQPDIVHEVTPDDVTTTSRTVELKGKRFRISDQIGTMPLLKFSTYAGMDIGNPKAQAAMYALLRDVIYEGAPACGECDDCAVGNSRSCKAFDVGDWQKFEDHAMETKANADELMDVITDVMELLSGRPTEPSSTSSTGRRAISGRSTGSSSGKRAKGSRR